MTLYNIQPGDTLSSIASKLGLSVDTLQKLNPTVSVNGNRITWSPSLSLTNGTVVLPDTEAMPAAQDALNKLTGPNRDAYAALTNLFSGFGLSDLAPTILQYLQQGFSADTISVLLQETPAYKERFSGNDARSANGLAVLTPAEYLSTEASYRQLLQSAWGVDPSMMSQSNFADWIGKDISPAEMQSRVNLAVSASSGADPSVRQALAQLGVTQGDVIGFFLNGNKPLVGLQQKLTQAQIMGAGNQSGLTVDPGRASVFAQEGVTYQQAQNAYEKVGQLLPAAEALTSIYKNQTPYGQTEAENQYLSSNGWAAQAQQALGHQETATFSGQGGVGQKSFAQPNTGQS